MGLMFPSTEVDQADMYIWAAGFDPNSPRFGFPAPISPGADVFSTSIGFGAWAPISGTASAMLDHLMTYGRGGKGCLCFFSAGNADNNFTTYRPWAAYEKTFGMAAWTSGCRGRMCDGTRVPVARTRRPRPGLVGTGPGHGPIG
jgi:hypothetical protein